VICDLYIRQQKSAVGNAIHDAAFIVSQLALFIANNQIAKD
jgi:hypothetical protein